MRYLKTYETHKNEKDEILSLIYDFMNEYQPDYEYELKNKHIIKKWYLTDTIELEFVDIYSRNPDNQQMVTITIGEKIDGEAGINIYLDYNSNPFKNEMIYKLNGFWTKYNYDDIQKMISEYPIYKESKELGII